MTVEMKSIEMTTSRGGKVLELRVQGKLEREDYATFVPEIERLIERHGKLRILFVMEDFHGWTAGALWEDIKFDARHFNHIERLAIVGEEKWQKGMAAFCKPFTTATVRYFDRADADVARAWIEAEAPTG